MLKKCLLGLFVGFVGLFSFSNGGFISSPSVLTIYSNSSVDVGPYTCVRTDNGLCFQAGIFIEDGITTNGYNNGYGMYCFINSGVYQNSYRSSCTYYLYDLSSFNLSSSCPECEICPEIDTGAILSGACDTNYCVQNDLCPSSSGSRSELMINNIVHEGKPLINISIPDSIYWDYATDDNQFDLYVGSGYNQDYIDSVLAINSYRPDNQDFTNIFVSGLTLIFPYIFVALLIVFIWKLLKRIFK